MTMRISSIACTFAIAALIIMTQAERRLEIGRCAHALAHTGASDEIVVCLVYGGSCLWYSKSSRMDSW